MDSKGNSSSVGKAVRAIYGVIYLLLYIIYSYLILLIHLILPPSMKSLDGEIFLITGAANGIGKAVALYLAQNHPKTTLVLWDCNQEQNLETARQAKALGSQKVHSYEVDVVDKEAVKSVADKVKKEVGHVSILFNNAGVAKGEKFFQTSDQDLETTIQVNLVSHFWTLRAFVPHMIQNNHGHIVTTGSMGSFFGHQSCIPYFATKFAIRGYIESLQDELKAMPTPTNGIVFTTVFPSFVETPMTTNISVKVGTNKKYMKVDYVAKKIVDGVRRNREKIVLPPSYEVLIFFKGILPSKAFWKLREVLMQTKLGRKRPN